MNEYFTYIVIFAAENQEYEPIKYYTDIDDLRKDNAGTMHMLDKDIVPVLPGLEYTLHLPRLAMDLYNLDEDVIAAAHDESHNIILLPSAVVEAALMQMKEAKPALVIYADECENEIKNIVKKVQPILGANKISDLNGSLLQAHWNQLYEYVRDNNFEKVSDMDNQFLFKDTYLKVLPLMFLARQYRNVGDILQKIYNTMEIEKRCAELQLIQGAHQSTLMRLHNLGKHDLESASLVYNDVFTKEIRKSILNVVITFPGIPNEQKKYGGLSNNLPDDEKRIIQILGVHRAIAKDAVMLELPCAKEDIFKKINEIEIRCKGGTNGQYVWRALKELGNLLGEYMKDYQLGIIMRARHLTIFSDLPIGLAVLKDTEVPLNCYKSISYKPLTPLTRQLQIEMVKSRLVYLGKTCKVVFAECIIPNIKNSLIRPCTDALKDSLMDMQQKYPDFTLVYRETYSVKSLMNLIDSNNDADILFISAHGSYTREKNMAGLTIGEEVWMADSSNIKVPPVVILSACHVSPRGSGAVSVADMFMRLGAVTVLGTFIPILANRNAILMTRLFTYILEGQKGSKQYETLADAWAGVVATNAIHELMHSSAGFEKWMTGTNPNGKIRLVEFQLEKSVGKIHPMTIYSDTINVIKEMMEEENMGGKFKNILEDMDFFPESLFYQFIGYPENIFIYNEVYKQAYEQADGKSLGKEI